MGWLSLLALGVLFSQVMSFQWALAEMGKRMAIAENLDIPPINYQNSITPPWLVKLWMLLALGVVSTISVVGYFGGLFDIVIGLLAFVAAFIISGAANFTLSRPRPVTYYRWALHTLANREADYRRDNDIARADAAKRFQYIMIDLLGDELRNK